MAISMDQLCDLLQEAELDYYRHPRREALVVPLRSVAVRMRLEDEGRILSTRVRYVAVLPDNEHLERSLRYISALNHRLRWYRFGWDERTGEVAVSENVRIADGTLTVEQLEWMVYAMVSMVEDQASALRRLADAGRRGSRHPELDDLLADLAGGSSGSITIPDLPSQPVAEAVWLQLVADTLGALTRSLRSAPNLARARHEVWPALRQLREQSTAAGEEYLLPTLMAEAEVAPAEEYVLLFMLARQAQGDRRIMDHELERVAGEGCNIDDLCQRLRAAGLIVDLDDDDCEPWRLSSQVLEPLIGRLPFEYVAPPPAFDVADLPAGPLAEAEWLALVHRVLAQQTAEDGEPARLDLLRTVHWPALLALRAESVAGGERYATASARAEHELTDVTELAVAFIAQQHAVGQTRISSTDIHRVTTDWNGEARPVSSKALLSTGLIEACDNDDLPPFRLNAAGAAWRTP